VLGGFVPLDGRVSWVPRGATGYQPSNCYLITSGRSALLVDSGLAVHEREVVGELVSRLGAGSPISLFFTRGEMDCVSNLAPIAGRFEVEGLYTGGATNPFDAFDDVNMLRFRDRRHQIDKKGPGGDSVARTPVIDVLPGRPVAIESPLLRLLPTFWGWEAEAGALFTSDTFTHGTVDRLDAPRVIDSTTRDDAGVDTVARHLFAKYEWLAYPNATTGPIREWLAAKFDDLAPEIVAPTRGCVLRGRDVVQRHVALMLEALRRNPHE
jgi:hypothetical protein